MFIDWLPEVLRPWRTKSLSSLKGRTAKRSQAHVPVAAAVETLETLAMLSGSPISSIARSDFLTNPNGNLTGPNGGTPTTIAQNYLQQHYADLGLTASDVTNLKITSQNHSTLSGATYIYYQQTYAGIPVQDSYANIAIAADGSVISVGNRMVPNLASRINHGAAIVSPATAALLAGAYHGLTTATPPTTVNLPEDTQEPGATTFTNSDLSRQQIQVVPRYAVSAQGDVRPVWSLVLYSPKSADVLEVDIDALTGAQVDFFNRTFYMEDPSGTGGGAGGNSGNTSPNSLIDISAFASSTNASNAGTGSYLVYQLPVSSPDDGVRQSASSPEDSFSSPFGWHDINGVIGADYTDTRGNNVFAQEDFDGNNAGGTRPDGGQSLDFNFSLDLTGDPLLNVNASTTQLFYTVNILHDIHARYGFDAPSGNFQLNNYGAGGVGNDQVLAYTLDAGDINFGGPTTNNAYFTTAPEGQSGTIQMFLFTLTNPLRDSTFDTEVIVHEFGHGISTRLTGGPAQVDTLNAQQSGGMGEGWSDFWSLMMTQRPSDLGETPVPVGTYILGQPANGPGIRRHPYSTDMVINPVTYEDYNSSPEVHDAGEIWASTLWDLNWLLVDKYGFNADLYSGNGGNNRTLAIVMEALKLQPSFPTMLDGRDAILAADRLLYGGVDQAEIWQAFARRGMGFSADDGGNANSLNVTEAFDVPATRKGELSFDQSSYAVGDTVRITLKDIDLAGSGSQDIQVVSSAGDIETVHLTEVRNGGIFVGSIISKSSESQGYSINNGLLEVPRASTITISYLDSNDGSGAVVTVTDTANFYVYNDIVRYDFSNSDGSASNEGFTTSGPVNLWHLSTGRGLDLGHSSDDSFYFGQGENSNGGGVYAPNANGTLTSPLIDLTNFAGPVLLTFNTFMNFEDVNDTATISVITSSGTTLIASNNGLLSNLPDSTGGFQKITLDLSAFIGQKIRLAFNVQTNSTVQREGWYVDDIAVTAPLSTIEGTKWNDLNGNGVFDFGESPLAGWTIFLDNNNNGILDSVVTTVPQNFAIPDAPSQATASVMTSTLTLSNIVGNLTDVNVNLNINHARNSDLDVYLVSPNGTRVELFTNVGGNGQNFLNTTLDDQASFSINQGTAPFTGSYIPEGLLSALNGQSPNGVWTLEIHDHTPGATGTLVSWSLITTTPQGTTTTSSNVRAIPDYDTVNNVSSTLTSTLSVSGLIGPLTDLNVNLTINHGRNSDLDVYLISPAGTRVELFTDVGGLTQNFINTTLDDQANFSINLGAAPFIGSFSPEGLLSALNGENPNGLWTLEIHDDTAGFTGTLLNWSIIATTPEASAVTDANGRYVLTSVTGQSGNTFNVREVPQPGWIQTSPAPTQNNPFPAQQVTVPYGGIVRGIDFYNQYILPIITLPNPAVTYTENEPPVFIDNGARVTDANNTTFPNGTLTVTLTENGSIEDRLTIRNQGTGPSQIGVNGNTVTYGGVTIGTFNGGVGLNPLVVTFNANATTAAVQALLRSIQFEAVGENPSGKTRTVQFKMTDGSDGESAAATKQIIVIPVNDAPVVTVRDTTLDYLENSPAVNVDEQATVTDVDSPDFNGGYLKVTLLGNEGGPTQTKQQTFVSTDPPTTLNNGTTTSTMIVAGLAGVLTDVNVKVNITHTNNPDLTAWLIGPNGVKVKLFSNVGLSLTAHSSQNFINTVLDDEALVQILSNQATAPFTGSFIPEKELSTLDGQNPNGAWSLQITDALGNPLANDGTGQLNSWSLELTTVETSVNEKLAILNQGQGSGTIGLVGNRVTYGGVVIGTVSGGVGTTPLVINLNANATPAAVQLLAQNITVEIKGEVPIDGLRQVEFIVDDGDGGTSLPAVRFIRVIAVNDNPELTLPAGPTTYVERAQPTVLDTFAIVTDVDSVNFANGVLTVGITQNGDVTDRLGVRSSTPTVGQINVQGTNIRYGTTVIGTLAGGTSGTPLTVTFNDQATPAAVQALVRAITFQAQGNNPSTATRTITFQVTDGDGGTSTPATKIVTVSQINDPPVLTLSSIVPLTYNSNALPVNVDPGISLTDPDTANFKGGRLTVYVSNGASVRDRLNLISQGSVVVVNSNVFYSGLLVGKVTAGVSTSPLTVDFTADAGKEAVEAVARAVTFQVLGPAPTGGDRTVSFIMTDGSGGTSQPQSRLIHVQVENQAPVNSLPSAIYYSDVNLFDFSNPDGTISTEGFTSTGTNNLWHVSTGRNTDAGHTSGGSFYFGKGETTSGGGLYTANGRGTLTSPEIDLTNYSQGSGPLLLTFSTYMKFENINDTATVSVITSSGTTAIASNNGVLSNLPDTTNGFQTISLDLSDYIGQKIRLSFDVQTNSSINSEGWYVDDITLNLPFQFVTNEDEPVAISGITISDPDASLLPMQVTLSVQYGTLTINTGAANGLSAASIAGNGTDTVTLTGDQSSINATLQSLNGVVYQGVANYFGVDQLTITTSDLGNSGPGGVMTDTDLIFINVLSTYDGATITPSSSTAKNIRGNEALIDSSITAKLGDGQESLNKAVLLVNVGAGRNRSDRLRLMTEGKADGQINLVAGKNGASSIRIGKLTIGTLSGGSDGKPLKIVFNSNATAAHLQQILKRLTFRTAVQTTVYGTRTITYDFTDSLGVASSQTTKQLEVVRNP